MPVETNIVIVNFKENMTAEKFAAAMLDKNIKVVHAINTEHSKESLPSWFSFSSGIVDTELQSFQHGNKGYQVSYSESCNGINEAGNKLMIDME